MAGACADLTDPACACHLCSRTAPRSGLPPLRGAPRSGGEAPRLVATAGSPRRLRHPRARGLPTISSSSSLSVSNVSSPSLMSAPPPLLPSGRRPPARSRAARRWRPLPRRAVRLPSERTIAYPRVSVARGESAWSRAAAWSSETRRRSSRSTGALRSRSRLRFSRSRSRASDRRIELSSSAR